MYDVTDRYGSAMRPEMPQRCRADDALGYPSTEDEFAAATTSSRIGRMRAFRRAALGTRGRLDSRAGQICSIAIARAEIGGSSSPKSRGGPVSAAASSKRPRDGRSDRVFGVMALRSNQLRTEARGFYEHLGTQCQDAERLPKTLTEAL